MNLTEYIKFPRLRTAFMRNWPPDVVLKVSAAIQGMTKILKGFEMSFFESTAKQSNTCPQVNTCNQAYPPSRKGAGIEKKPRGDFVTSRFYGPS
jgi:hypothetical protein